MMKHRDGVDESGYPVMVRHDVGWLTETQMTEVDRVMIEDLGIGLIQMMENAGRNLAQFVIDRYRPEAVTILAGSGGNGGGGLVAARHLANRGIDVAVTLGRPVEALGPVTGHQFEILRRMGVAESDRPRRAEVVIDALIGYRLRGAPHGRVGDLVEQIGQVAEHVVALDTPSGLDVTDGSVPGCAVVADATVTLALPKVGLAEATQVGELYVADISVPPAVYHSIGAGPAPDFTRSSIIRLLDRPERG